MIRIQDIEMELDEAEGYLAAGKDDLARAKFELALSLLAQYAKSVERLGRVGGPLAGMTVAEVLGAVQGGIDHPLLDAIIGGIVGYAAGKKGSEVVTTGLSPLFARANNGLGDVFHRIGDDGQARRFYAIALKIQPNDPVTMQKMAEVT